MDLQVYAIILIVFLVSFLSYLFISKFLPHGKSFDEMIAEKKRMREELLGLAKTAPSKPSNAGNKKKPKKEVKKRDTQSKAAKEVTSNDSDASESSDAVISEPPTPPETLVLRKSAAKAQQAQQAGKKGKGKGGILVNKNEPVLVKDVRVEEEVNHFEEIHPKDDVEIHRAVVKEEGEKKHFRDTKKSKQAKVDTPPVSPKNQPLKEAKTAEEKPAKKKRNEPSTSAVDGGAVQLASDEAGITPVMREIRRADLTKNQIQVLIDFLLNKQSDTFAQDPTEWSEGKSDLVQKLKKQLQEKEAQLKNEQDALVGMQTKLKELRAELNTEKVHANANFKSHAEQLQNSRMEVKNLQQEIQFLSDKYNMEKQTLTGSYKQLQANFIQMQEKFKLQEDLPNIKQIQSDNAAMQLEIASKSQQLAAAIEELRQKDEQLKQLAIDRDTRIADIDVHSRKKDERFALLEAELRQKVQDLSNRDSEIQKLNVDAARAKELDSVVQRQTFELDQAKKQLSDQQQNNHAEENSKIEIRNLQNALDSSKKELDAQRIHVGDYKAKLDDLNKQLTESKQTTNSKAAGDSFLMNEKINELVASHQNAISQKDKQLSDYQKQVDTLQSVKNELTKMIEEQKAKNNDLRTKNWKLVEALQSAQQTSSTTKSANHSNFITHPSVEVTKVKELFTQHFPETTSSATSDDGAQWLESALENLKQHIVSNKSLSNTTNSPIANNVSNNHLNNCRDVDKKKLNSSALNGDSNSSTSQNADSEVVLLQNAQLKTTVEEYKTIIAETELMLKHLETKVGEQDAYWTKVVLMKDNEIEKLKAVSEKS